MTQHNGDKAATPAGNAVELPKTDVVLVGVGAAGGIAAHVFTQAGLEVVGIEAGPRLGIADFMEHLDELDGFFEWNWTGEPKANHEVPTWRRSEDAPYEPRGNNGQLANMVGGTSVHYMAASWRFHEDDFTIRSSTIERYGEEAIPEGAALADWAVTYDDLEPYYEKVEYLIGISGEKGANPFEAPRSNDYPMPPLQRSGYNKLVHQAMESLGYNPFPTPVAITSVPYNDRPACTLCGYCGGYGCWNNSKSSTLVTAIPEAEATGKFEIRPNSRVFRVLVDEDGKASGVEYRGEDGKMYIQPAGVVVLSAFLWENVRLLLLSRSEKFPNGLGNNNGQVGKYYMIHPFPSVNGVIPGENLNLMSGGEEQGTSMDDFNGDNFDHTDLGFIRGGVMRGTMTTSKPILRSRIVPPGHSTWGSEYKQWLRDGNNSVADISAILEALPYESNYIDLDPEVTDPDGVPVIRCTYDFQENEHRMWEYLEEKAKEILLEMGATEIWSAGPLNPTPRQNHAFGGARAGNDPETSVLNKHLLSHEVPNLAILGGAAFASGGGFNPTLTIQAWAWLAAEHIADNFDEITS